MNVFEDALKAQQEKQKEEDFKQAEIELNHRASGRTTRIIDAAIQEFFKKGEVTLIDHHEGGKNNRMNAYVAERFEARIRREHPNVHIIFSNNKGVHTAKISKR